MKRILHLSPLADVGGCEINLLRVVQGSPQFSHEVLVFHQRGPMSEQWRKAGAAVSHLECWTAGTARFVEALERFAARSESPAAIYYWSTSRLPVVVESLKHWMVPWVVHLGNPAGKTVRDRVRRWEWERKYSAHASVHLAACSRYVAESHRRAHYFRRFSTSVIYNPVSPEFEVKVHHRDLPKNANPRLGMVARLDGIKDHRTIIRALQHVIRRRRDVTVEFAGDGVLRSRLEHQVQRLGLEGHVQFLGFVPVEKRLQLWDIYLHSTTAAEGMGTAVAEAMSCGLPCVVSDLGMMREISGPDGALYFPCGDARELAETIVMLIDDLPRRRALASAARAQAARRFEPRAVVDAYLGLANLLQEVCP